MEPLDVADEVVDVSTLERWSATSPPPYQLDTNLEADTDTDALDSPFTYSPQLNGKIILWSGNIARLNCNAVVNSTNENLTDKSPDTKDIYAAAGPELIHDIKHNLKGCRTGEAKISKGYGLPSRHILHTVGPRYNVKYRTAAESALYSAYRSVLQLALENKLTSIALCAINSARRNYPIDDGTSLALRTVRRFLEVHGKYIDCIVFCVKGADKDSYEHQLPLFFPRSKSEEEYSRRHFYGRNIGDPVSGEPVISDRKIRISDKLVSGEGGGDKFVAARPGTGHLEGEDEGETEGRDAESSLGIISIGQTPFAKMHEDVDIHKQGKHDTSKLDTQTAMMEHERAYERIVRRARQEDFSDVTSNRCIYQGGEDRYGRPVVMVIGNRLPSSTHQLDRLLMYSFHLMDDVVKEPYVMVYFHTLSSTEKHAEMNFLRTLFLLCSERYIRNLSGLYIVHPTLWTKVIFWYNLRFRVRNIKERTIHLPGLEQLHARLGLAGNFDIPTFIRQYDLKVNGSNYYTVPVETASEL